MGWLKKWRERRARLVGNSASGASRSAEQEPPLSQILSVNQVLTEIAKTRLDLERAQATTELELMKMRLEEKKVEAQARVEERERDRERRAKAAERTREWNRAHPGKRSLKHGGDLPPFMLQCEDCRAALEGRKPHHNNDMVKHAGHLGALGTVLLDRTVKLDVAAN